MKWLWGALAIVSLGACHSDAARPATATGGGPHRSAPAPPNELALYLRGAEQQFETEEQGAEIRRALMDMLTLSPEALCANRYADYGLAPHSWTIGELLRHYFVPNPPRSLNDEATICVDSASPETRRLIQEQIRAIDERRQPSF